MERVSPIDRMRPRITLIAAMDRMRAIGRGNALPWHLPDDLKRFKSLTLNQTVLMGRRTAESLGRALPRRRNLVLTRSGHAPFEGMETVTNLQEALAIAGTGETLHVIGGGEIYAQALPLVDVMHLTLVDCIVDDADTFFPEFDARDWIEQSRSRHDGDDRHAHGFEFVDLIRIR